MKTYDFDRIVDRHGTNAVKYDALTDVFGSKELLPLWVADMDFATPDFILEPAHHGFPVPPCSARRALFRCLALRPLLFEFRFQFFFGDV